MTEFNERYITRHFSNFIHQCIRLIHPHQHLLYDLKIIDHPDEGYQEYPRIYIELSHLFDVTILGKDVKDTKDDEGVLLEPHKIEELQELFMSHKVPFIFEWNKKGDEIDFTLSYNSEITNDIPADTNYLERYMEDMRYIGEYDIRKMTSWLEGVTLLYNATYWPFFPDEPDHIYSVEEVNIIFMAKHIKYYIMKNKRFSRKDCGIVNVYHVVRTA